MASCRACGHPEPLLFLPLGEHPPANAFLPADRLHLPEACFPLDAHVCLSCALIQVPDHVPPGFFHHYLYVPSAATTMHRHFEALAEALLPSLADGRLLVDIGSNDGLFLSFAHARGVRTLGVEPAANLAAVARERGIDVVEGTFGPETAAAILAEHGPAAVIVTTNTLNHVDDLHAFMEGVRVLLADDGEVVVEVPHSLDLVQRNEFDTIYHEHLSEFSVRSFVELARPFGLAVAGVETLPVHGGSLRYRLRRGSAHSEAVESRLERERAAGLHDAETYAALARRVEALRTDLVQLLQELRAEGATVAGYGAPAKGNTLLNFCGIGPDLVSWLADRSELKQGLFTPGMHIPVVSPERILEEQPSHLLLLAWNFADEIVEQQAEYLRRGGRFVVPVPEPRIVAGP
jgi:hypothetical protein